MDMKNFMPGDKVKVSFDGDLLFQTTYPEKSCSQMGSNYQY